MTDDEVRALIRSAIQKHLGAGPVSATPSAPPEPPPLSMSFGRYRVTRIADDSMCLIEPAVRCNHCGFCESHGH